MPSHRLRSPSLWSLVLLLASLALVATLAWQALEAERSHRQTAEGVLRDYAELAASEMVRRATAEIGYRGYYPAITLLVKTEESGVPLPDPRDLAADQDRGAELVATTFRIAADGGGFVSRGAVLDGAGRDIVESRIAHADAGGGPYAVEHVVVDGRARVFLWAQAGDARVGFEVDRGGLARRLQSTAEAAPLLPASLLEDGQPPGNVAVRLIDPAGHDVFASGAASEWTFAAETPFGDAYSGIFDGYRVAAAIDPGLAPVLVIGGLPRSRLPLLAALTLLAAALAAGAYFQIRRERLLARLRSDFVARVSHELRTPLAQIRLFAETLRLDRVRSEAERRRALEVIDRESARLAALVDNVLRFSRAERGLDGLHPEVRDLARLLPEIARDAASLVEGHGGRLELAVAAGPVPARVDRDALQQIVLNLLENAVQHGGPRQTVTLGLERDAGEGRARLWVADRGPGVPQSERERIFEPYVRGTAANGGGAGIGLSVVRDLARRLGGEARCLAEHDGSGGARFEVALPLATGEGPTGAGP